VLVSHGRPSPRRHVEWPTPTLAQLRRATESLRRAWLAKTDNKPHALDRRVYSLLKTSEMYVRLGRLEDASYALEDAVALLTER
jgi:hypothetical protein